MSQDDLTRLLAAADGGDREAIAGLYRAVYAELRRMAQSQMRRERDAVTLQPTVLVNEAYLRLAPARSGWQNRRHFFGAAAEAMRRILVDHARQRLSHKRGAGVERVTLSGVDLPVEAEDTDLLDVDEALTELAAAHPRIVELVKLRFFAGLGIEDAARVLDVSPATAKRDWTFARAWLKERLNSRDAT